MSKKTVFLIILICVVFVIGLICGIRAIKNFYIIQTIFNKIQTNIGVDNYYLRTTITHNEETSLTKVYYKNGFGKMVAENGVYTWVNEEVAYIVDEENKKLYMLDVESSIGLVSNEMFASLVPGYSKNTFEKFMMGADLRNQIKSDKVDDKKCYKITINEEKFSKTYWIEKNSKKPLKAIVEFVNGDKYEYNYELQFNVVGIKDIELPDLSDYTKIDNKTGEVIE